MKDDLDDLKKGATGNDENLPDILLKDNSIMVTAEKQDRIQKYRKDNLQTFKIILIFFLLKLITSSSVQSISYYCQFI